MAEGYFERGEIYAIRLDAGFGSEEGAFRPGVIVSNNQGNASSPTVNICYLTTKPKLNTVSVFTDATGRDSWIMCNQIATIDKTRLGRLMGTLNAAETREVEDKLEFVFDLGYSDEAAIAAAKTETEKVRVSLEGEIAGLQSRLKEKESEIDSRRVEIDMWQKLYERALDQLVKMKLHGDISRRMEAPVEQPVKTPEPPVEPPKQPELPEEPVETRVDINHCTATALKKIGFSLAMSKLIVSYRPFESVQDLKRVPGLKATLYRIMEPKLCCTPVPVAEPEPEPVAAKKEPDPGYEIEPDEVVPGKVNVNTATAVEIQKAGISGNPAYAIVKYRRENGPFKTLDDLLNVPYCGKIFMSRHGNKLEV